MSEITESGIIIICYNQVSACAKLIHGDCAFARLLGGALRAIQSM